MDDYGLLCVSASLSDDADEVEAVSDGTVGIRPAGGAKLTYVQDAIILEGGTDTVSHLRLNNYLFDKVFDSIVRVCHLRRLHRKILQQKAFVIG